MKTFTVRQILNPSWVLLDKRDARFCIYVFRDEATVFYVGKSKEPQTRVLTHLGRNYRFGCSNVGDMVEVNKPKSLSWQVDFYTLVDCLWAVPIYAPDTAEYYKAHLQDDREGLMEIAEKCMIADLRPYLNSTYNHEAKALPDKYKTLY